MRDFFTDWGGDFCDGKQLDNEPDAGRVGDNAATFEAPTQTTIFLGIGAASGDLFAPSSTKFAGGASLDLGATSTANALFGACGFGGGLDAGFTASDNEGRAGGAAVVLAAPSTAEALIGATGTFDLVAPCFRGALFESELTFPAGS